MDAFLSWVTHLVHDHRARLARIARGEGLHAEDALDAVQEAFHSFLLLPQARELVDEADDAAKLLTVLVRNAARNARRRRFRARPHGEDGLADLRDGGPAVDDLLAQADEHVRLRGCVNQLGTLQRKVVLLRMLDEVPGEDVAAMLGISAGNVAVLLHRAKASLRVCMECENDIDRED